MDEIIYLPSFLFETSKHLKETLKGYLPFNKNFKNLKFRYEEADPDIWKNYGFLLFLLRLNFATTLVSEFWQMSQKRFFSRVFLTLK